jgi:hypothetical protein
MKINFVSFSSARNVLVTLLLAITMMICGCANNDKSSGIWEKAPDPLTILTSVDSTGSAIAQRAGMKALFGDVLKASLDVGRAEVSYTMTSFGQEVRVAVPNSTIGEAYEAEEAIDKIADLATPGTKGTKWAPMLRELHESIKKSTSDVIVLILSDGEITDFALAKKEVGAILSSKKVRAVVVGPTANDYNGSQLLKKVKDLFGNSKKLVITLSGQQNTTDMVGSFVK